MARTSYIRGWGGVPVRRAIRPDTALRPRVTVCVPWCLCALVSVYTAFTAA